MTIERIVEFDGNGIDFKAVQMITDEGPFLIVGYKIHGELVDAFLDSKGIPFRPMRLADDSIHARTRSVPGQPEYDLVGAGIVKKVDDAYFLSGKSTGYYGLEPNKEHAEELNKLSQNAYNIEIL